MLNIIRIYCREIDFINLTTIKCGATVVFAFDDYYHFSILQSSFHEQWARRYSSTLKNDLSYTPSTAFQTFPFPTHPKEHRGILEKVGEFYDKHRSQVMLKYQEGLTAIYNRFHDPEDHHSDIIRLRELHMEIDLAVAFAYGWEDLDLGHDFHETPQGLRFTVSEVARREILTRLLESNYRRYQEEVARGLHKEKGSESSHKERSRRATKTRNRKKSSPKSKQVAEQSPGYQVRKGRPKAQPSRAQASFLDIVDETVPDVLTRMPFFGLAGSIYCSPMPFGRNDPEGYAYQDMRRKGVSTIVMLASDAEAEAKAHRNLRKMYQKDGFNVIQFPIPDYQIPGRKDLEPVLEQVLTLAKKGENIAVHCSGGVGRTGLFMAELAKKALKMSGQSALYWVRLYIPGAVETKEQERFVVGNE
jgi:protein-tyrosine phosphatase